MCYNVSYYAGLAELRQAFPNVFLHETVAPKSITAPLVIGHSFPQHPILLLERKNFTLQCRMMEWGIIPFWIKDVKAFKPQRSGMLNARSEKILTDTNSYWYKIRNRRCLIPVTGIFEFQKVTGYAHKIPYLIQMQQEPVFFLPGLYSITEIPVTTNHEPTQCHTFTLITTKGNGIMQEIHNKGTDAGRMPLFLTKEQAITWLSEQLKPQDYGDLLSFCIGSEALQYQTVYTLKADGKRPDGKQITDKYDWGLLPGRIF